MRAAGHAYALLTSGNIALIHQGALTILERMGMEIQNRTLLEGLEVRGADVDYASERVTFPKAFVERFIADAPKHDWERGAPSYTVSGSAGVYESLYHDPDSNELVPWTEERMALYFALARTLPRVTGASMLGSRLSVPGPLEPLYERYYCWKYGASEAGTILNDEVCPFLLDLYEIGRAHV